MKLSLLAVCMAVAPVVTSAAKKGSVVKANGFTDHNDYHGPLPHPEFDAWCGHDCHEEAKIDIYDSKKHTHLGYLYTWVKNFDLYDCEITFDEFFVLDIKKKGKIFGVSNSKSCGGGLPDYHKLPVKQGDFPLYFGCEGHLVGGKGKYVKASGDYSIRGIIGYDESTHPASPFFYDKVLIHLEHVKL